MKTEDDHRKELIRRHLSLIRDEKVSTAIQLWQTFASKLISILGEDGFLVLYSRSLHLLRDAFPMLPNADPAPSSNAWLTALETALNGQDLIEANSANHQLMMIFTDILAALIGEDLTIEILISAWGENTIKSNPASKEVDDEK